MLLVTDETRRLYASGGTAYIPHRHRIIECPWIESVRRNTGKQEAFLYRHAVSGQYVLAMWVVRPNTGMGPGLFMELETMNAHPDHPKCSDRPSMPFVRARFRPVGNMLKDFDQRIELSHQAELMAIDDDNRIRTDVAKHLMRSANPKLKRTGEGIMSGELPFASEAVAPAEHAAMTQALTELAG